MRTINRELGDPNFAGAVHPFRLAGFTNRKPAYEQPNGHYPFVKLLGSADQDCALTAAEVDGFRRALEADRQRLGTLTTGQGVAQVEPHELVRLAPSTPALEAYVAHRANVEAFVASRGWAKDESRVDFEVAKRMTRQGFGVHEVAQAIHTASPLLEVRHADPETYSWRTAQRGAIAAVPPRRTPDIER